MARSLLTPTESAPGGLEITSGAAALEAANVDGNMIPGDGSVILVVYNGDASSKTVTIQTPGTVDGLAIAEIAQAIPTLDYYVFGPFTVKSAYVQPTDGNIWVDYSAETNVEVGAIRIKT